MELSALIEACKKGRREDQKIFFMQFYGRVLKTCKRYSKDDHEAKDFAQESMIRVFEQLHTLKNADSVNAWVQRVTVNNCLIHIRKQKLEFMQPLEDHHFSSISDVIDEETEERHKPEEVMESIQKLPLGYRTVLNLYVFEKYTHRDIAKELGISEGTSKSQLNKARHYLKKILSTNTHDIQYEQSK